MARTKKKEKGFWNLVDRFQGDKVIWMIVILLILISIVSVFSSTPLLARETGGSRMSIVRSQMLTAAIGIGLIILCYSIKSIGVFRFFSQFGFAVSFILLAILVSGANLGFVRAAEINGARRILVMFGFQIHVYEVVKVAMVMYLAWAVNALKDDEFTIANYLSANFTRLAFLGNDFWKKAIYIYVPILIVCAMMFVGGTSSVLFFAMIVFLTIYVGGVRLKEIFIMGGFLAAYLAFAVVLYKATESKEHPIILSGRIATAINRLKNNDDDMNVIAEKGRNTIEFQEAMDRLRQPVSALIAIKEGGIFGKGPGRSTQKYVVPVIFGDYMFSFIVEEYGLIGALIIIILYVSLLARGALIARGCDNYFAKVAVAGLILLITAQAFMHMAINVHLAPQTGQTLPLISHGTSSFLSFCIAFGIILSISRMVHMKMLEKAESADPIIVRSQDEVQDGMNELEMLETEDFNKYGQDTGDY